MILTRFQFNKDESEWNGDDLQLGLVKGQTYNNLNLDLGQFLNEREDNNGCHFNSSINDPNVSSLDNSGLNDSSKGIVKIFQKNITQNEIDSLTESLKMNYWEL
jgi:hypothetical protein